MKFTSKQGELVENRTKENKYTDKQKESENGKSKNTLGSDVSVRNMIQVPENINRNSRETIIYIF